MSADCTACCACCMTEGAPPVYRLIIANGYCPEHLRPDYERLVRLPRRIKKQLDRYVRSGRWKEGGSHGPCLWLDEATMECKYYEYRSSVCRDYEAGGRACTVARDRTMTQLTMVA